MVRNPGHDLDYEWVCSNAHINLTWVEKRVEYFRSCRPLKGKYQTAWLLKAITCIELATLNCGDTESKVSRLCVKATRPITDTVLGKLEVNRSFQAAAVCVYPTKVECALLTLSNFKASDKIKVASVATGYPSGQFPLATRLAEIEYAIEKGATEIDVVIDRTLALTGQWSQLYQEIKQMRDICGDGVCLKTTLGISDLENLKNIYKAAMVAMMAGSDFINTSTVMARKIAHFPPGVVMCRAIKDYYEKTGHKVGLKVSACVDLVIRAQAWMVIVKEELGVEWLTPELFRIETSELLVDIERQIYYYATNRYAAYHEFSMG